MTLACEAIAARIVSSDEPDVPDDADEDDGDADAATDDQDEFARLAFGFDAAEFVRFGVEFRQRTAEDVVGHAFTSVMEPADEMSDNSFYVSREGRSRKEVTPAERGRTAKAVPRRSGDSAEGVG